MLISSQYNHSSTRVNNYSSLTAYDLGYMFGRMKYGERLRKARMHAELTQQELAERIKNVCTQENISKLERGDATGSEYTAQFAEACGVRAIWLAAESGDMLSEAYSTNDPDLIEILQVLEDRADYIKKAAVSDVMTICKLAEQSAAAEFHVDPRKPARAVVLSTDNKTPRTGPTVLGTENKSPRKGPTVINLDNTATKPKGKPRKKSEDGAA